MIALIAVLLLAALFAACAAAETDHPLPGGSDGTGFAGTETPLAQDTPDGAAVRALQEKLVELGYLDEDPSGVMDDTTQAAWAAFQADNGLESVAAYIGNKNSKKFHKPDCNSVGDMKESNKVRFSTREEAVESGYVPCKRCNP